MFVPNYGSLPDSVHALPKSIFVIVPRNMRDMTDFIHKLVEHLGLCQFSLRGAVDLLQVLCLSTVPLLFPKVIIKQTF